MHQPFQPEMAGGAVAAAAAGTSAGSPLIAQGKQIFESKGCVACHGEGGTGTAMAIKLIGIGQKLTPDQLANLIRHPNTKMTAGGMPAFPLSDDDMKALIAYLDSLR